MVQFTPPGSACSISFGEGLTSADPGDLQRLQMAVHDIEAVREDLLARGVEVSDFFHRDESGLAPGLHPQRVSYLSHASFSDPDGNTFLLQEITERRPGR